MGIGSAKLGINGVACILVLHFYAFALQIPALTVGTTLAMLGMLLLRGVHARFELRGVVVLAVASMLLFAPAFLKPWHGFSPIYYGLSSLVSLGIASLVTRDAETLRLAYVRVYWATAALLCALLALNNGSREPLGEVIPGASTNGIPAYLIVMQIGLTLSSYASVQRLPLISPLMTFFIAFMGNGRGSLVVATLLIVGTLALGVLGGRHSSFSRKACIAAGVATLAGLAVAYGDLVFEYVLSHTKLSVGLVDANRGTILAQYIAKLDAYTLLAGASYDGTLISEVYNNNPHIAYVRAHSFFGLLYTMLALFSPALVLLGRGSLWVKAIFIYFIALAVVRAASEPVLFPTLLDMVYFSWFFLYFRRKRATAPRLTAKEATTDAATV